jgi:alpha-ribazole phosphatase
MSDFLFIRHAETDMTGTFCGHSNPALNARGHAQLADLIDSLRKEEISAVYSSDLCRAHTTAMAVAKAFGVGCYVRSALREINFGQWEGATWKEIEERDISYAHRWLAEYPHLPAPDGERFYDFEARVLNEVKLLSSELEATDHPIAVVTHAGVLRTVLCALHGCSEDNAREQTRSYCSVIRHTTVTSCSVQTTEVGS